MSKQFWLGILIGVVALVVLFTITVAIGCAVNGITFGEQIVAWFMPGKELVPIVATPIA